MDALKSLGIFALVGSISALSACEESTARVALRNKFTWPFNEASVWNTSIGSGARYVPADIAPVDVVALTSSFFVTTTVNDPLRSLLEPGGPDRCGGTEMFDVIRVPDAFVLPEGQNASPGNSTSLLQPDGHTLIEVSGMARCASGGPIFGFRFPDGDLYGDGRLGGQGGSGLSSLGGSLRQGELTNGLPVRHALKVSLWSYLYYFSDPSVPNSCFRWPADRCDGGHAQAGEDGYHGSKPELTMGSLLALLPTQRAKDVGLETEAGALMFAALRDYGAYVVGNAAVDWAMWGIDAGARDMFKKQLGPAFEGWQRDVNRLLPLLHVVANNGPNQVGGGGVARQPLPPPIGN